MQTNTELSNKIEQLQTQFKDCKLPATAEDLEKLKKDMKSYGVRNPGIPTEMEMVWKTSSEWHLTEDHYNVFGFNLYSPRDILKTTNDIFGNKEMKKNWLEYVGEDSCGDNDWLCIVGYSEYDYIFANFNKESSLFGATRHIVNNCTIEEKLTNPPFSNFIEYIDQHIKNIEPIEDV